MTADHGQNLAENGPNAFSHGFDVHQAVMHIPLIIRGYGLNIPQGRVVQRAFGLSGLAPTIEAVLGLPDRLGQKRSFADALAPGPVWDADGWPSRPTVPVFMEATRPYAKEGTLGWNNLHTPRGLRLSNDKLIVRPQARSRSESENDYSLQGLLREMLQQWDASAPPFRAKNYSEDTRQALEALGYLEPVSSD